MKKRFIVLAVCATLFAMVGTSRAAPPRFRGDKPILVERWTFAPGKVFDAKSAELNKQRPAWKFLLPASMKKDATYALLIRCRARDDATFNWLEVSANGQSAGRVFPCSAKKTRNMKVLIRGDGAGSVALKVTLKEGTGCVIKDVRFYEASKAYTIKTLHPDDVRPEVPPKPFTPTDEFRDHTVNTALWLESRGKSMGVWSLNVNGLVFFMSRWGKDPETFRMLMGLYLEYLETPEMLRRFDPSASAFHMYSAIAHWDKLEADPAFSNAWRLEIVNAFFLMARVSFIDWSAYSLPRYYRDYRKRFPKEWRSLGIAGAAFVYPLEDMVADKLDAAEVFNKRHAHLPHNHSSHPARSLWHAAQYFKRYNLPQIPVWKRCAAFIFDSAMKSSKPQEDCVSYERSAMVIIAAHAKDSGRKEFFAKGGPLWKFTDLVIMSTNNIGDGAGYGDVDYYPQIKTMPRVLETDIFDAIVKKSPLWMTDDYRKILLQKQRADYLGVRAHPLEPLFYQYAMDRWGGEKIPEARRFDKISFRRSFKPNDQYLLLDGISLGYHGHQDGNSIAQFDDENRTWLADRGRPKAGWAVRFKNSAGHAQQHNVVTVSRPDVDKGQPSPLDKTPIFSELLRKQDGKEIASTSTITRNLNGVDWTRHIVWVKEQYFVVFDELVARRDGPVTLACRWRSLGEPRLTGRRWLVTQRPKKSARVKDTRALSLVLINCDTGVLSQTVGLEPPKIWRKYPYAEPTVPVLEQTLKGNFQTGRGHCFINVFGVTPAGSENLLKAKRLDNQTIEVTYKNHSRRVSMPSGKDTKD